MNLLHKSSFPFKIYFLCVFMALVLLLLPDGDIMYIPAIVHNNLI